MRDAKLWRPSKFVLRRGKWRVSRDPRELAPVSRISASLALDAYCKAIETYARGHLADFGCGKVPLFGFYRDLVEEVTCIDWPGSLHESPHIDVSADLNQPTGIPDDSFDTILSSSVLEHIWKHETFWDEMARTLRPGGRIILGVPFIYWLHEEPHDYFRWTRFALAKACEERGLRVVKLEPYGGGLDVLADIFIRCLGFVSKPVAGWIATAAAAALRTRGARRLSARSSEKLPLGYVLVAEK